MTGVQTCALPICPDVLEALRDALKDKDPSVRAAAVHSLALRGDPALIEDIAPLLNDSKPSVRLRAAAAYVRLVWVKAGSPGDTDTKLSTPAKKATNAAPGSPAAGKSTAKK